MVPREAHGTRTKKRKAKELKSDEVNRQKKENVLKLSKKSSSKSASYRPSKNDDKPKKKVKIQEELSCFSIHYFYILISFI